MAYLIILPHVELFLAFIFGIIREIQSTTSTLQTQKGQKDDFSFTEAYNYDYMTISQYLDIRSA
jgi:hypothetical protein